MVAMIAVSVVATIAVSGLVVVILLRRRQDTKALLDIAWLAAETHDRGFRRGLQRDSDEPVADQPSLLDLRPETPRPTDMGEPEPPFQHPDEVEMGTPE